MQNDDQETPPGRRLKRNSKIQSKYQQSIGEGREETSGAYLAAAGVQLTTAAAADESICRSAVLQYRCCVTDGASTK